jgi:hypothetical protein
LKKLDSFVAYHVHIVQFNEHFVSLIATV